MDSNVRNFSIDSLKGLLIFLVILGHCILGSVDHNIFRYLIYSFHMPLFMFISGYLINLTALKSISTRLFMTKYWNRMIKEWAIALIVYSTLLFIANGISFVYVIKRIILPHYHLWYVPVLLIMIISSVLLEKNVHNKFTRLFVYIVIALVLYAIRTLDIPYIEYYRTHLFCFFYLGIICKEFNIVEKIHYNDFVSAGGGFVMLFVVLTFFFLGLTMEGYIKSFLLPINIFLCVWCILPIIYRNQWHSMTLAYIGRNSLHFYLWHVIVIMAVKDLFHNNLSYYLSIVMIMILLFLTIQIIIKYETFKTVCDSRNRRKLL